MNTNTKSTPPLVSIIVRTKNEERWIGHCIQSVIDFLDSPEIVVIDNNSVRFYLTNVL